MPKDEEQKHNRTTAQLHNRTTAQPHNRTTAQYRNEKEKEGLAQHKNNMTTRSAHSTTQHSTAQLLHNSTPHTNTRHRTAQNDATHNTASHTTQQHHSTSTNTHAPGLIGTHRLPFGGHKNRHRLAQRPHARLPPVLHDEVQTMARWDVEHVNGWMRRCCR